MSEQRVFKAVVAKEAGWWNIWIPELDHVTSTRKSRKISLYTRSLIAATPCNGAGVASSAVASGRNTSSSASHCFVSSAQQYAIVRSTMA